MKRGIGRLFWLLLKYGVSLACLIYVFRGVPLSDLWATLKRYPPLPMGGVLVVALVGYVAMGTRLAFMATPSLTFRSTFCATLVGQALNNVLPAKAGEIAKAAWIARSNGVSFHKTLGIVFMERFFDVNVLALLSLWFLWSLGERGVVAGFVACLAAGWAVLLLFSLRPSVAERFCRLFGQGRLGNFVSQALSGILSNMTSRQLIWLCWTSLAVWAIHAFQMYLNLNAVAGLGLNWDAALAVFAVSGLSMLLPSSPGAIGVYEAFTAAMLKAYGIPAEEALAVALFAHMMQFIPVTTAGGIIFAAFPQKIEEKEKNCPS